MPTREGKTQIQVDIKTRDTLKQLKGLLDYDTYDELIWKMIEESKFNNILSMAEELKEKLQDIRINEDITLSIDETKVHLNTEIEEPENIEWSLDEKTGKNVGISGGFMYFKDIKSGRITSRHKLIINDKEKIEKE